MAINVIEKSFKYNHFEVYTRSNFTSKTTLIFVIIIIYHDQAILKRVTST